MPATLDDVVRSLSHVEDWLAAVSQHTGETKDALAAKKKGEEEGAAGRRIKEYAARLDGLLAAAGGSALGQAKTLERRGFGGTLEQERLNYSLDQLGRQFAAVMKPVTDAMTYAAVQIERRMRSMNGSEQNRLMGGIIGAGLGMRYGGVGGAIAGGMAGMLAMGGTTGRYDATMGAVTGAYLGFRAAGPVGAVAGAVGGATTGGGWGSYYRMYKRETSRDLWGDSFVSRSAAALAASGATVADAVSGGSIREHVTKTGRMTAADRAPSGAPASSPPRAVTPYSSEQLEVGGTASRIQQGIIRATAGAEYEEDNPLKPIIDMMLEILDVLLRIQNPDYTPPPRSSGGART